MKSCVHALWSWVRAEVPDFLISVVFELVLVALGLLFLAFWICLLLALAYLSWVISQKITSSLF